MARPKLFVRVKWHKGKPKRIPKPDQDACPACHDEYDRAEPIAGLHYHVGTGRFYRLVCHPERPTKTKIEYLGYDLQDAIAAIRQDDPLQDHTDHLLTAMDNHVRVLKELVRRHRNATIGKVDDDGNDALQFVQKMIEDIVKPTPPPPQIIIQNSKPETPSKYKLSDCVNFWAKMKTADKRKPDTIDSVKRRFQHFIDTITDLPVNQLTQDHLNDWEMHIKARQNNENWSNKTYNEYHDVVKRVILFARKKNLKWGWTQGMTEWFDFDHKPYKPKRENRQAITPDEVHQLLESARQWTQINVDEMPKTNQQERGLRKQAIGRKRDGFQLLAMVRLMVQAGLGNTDTSELKWSHIDLTNGILDYDRDKPEWATGQAEWRKMPLLDSTIDALRQWREFEPVREDGFVFTNQQKQPFNKTTIGRLMGRLCLASGIDRTIKHLRNVGGTVGKKHKLSQDERQTFLGHANPTTASFYEDDMEYEYLANLVALIGKDYDL